MAQNQCQGHPGGGPVVGWPQPGPFIHGYAHTQRPLVNGLDRGVLCYCGPYDTVWPSR
jgi:hypothetical protein